MTKKERAVTAVVYSIYLVLLTWLVLFKLSVNLDEIISINMRSLNFVPLKASAMVNGRILLSEIIYNILAFVPLGVYMQVMKPDWAFLKKVLPGLILSVAFEAIQYAFSIGATDITDVIANTLGGAIGIGLCMGLHKIFGKKHVSIINIIGIIIEAIAIALVILLTIANM